MNRLPSVILLSSAIAALPLAAPAIDGHWGEAEVRLDSLLSAGVAVRAEGRDPDLIGRANGGNSFSTNVDDGDLAFDSGELVGGAVKLTSSLTLTFRDYGLFARGSYFYDAVRDGHDFFDPADYGAGREFGEDERARKSALVEDRVARDGDVLDAYVFGSFALGERTLTGRLGKQVLNWGEATLVQNGVNSLLALDANQLRVPGAEIEEVIVPVPMAWLSVDALPGITLEAFYQFGWEPTTPDAAGTFWSTNDFLVEGGTQANLGFGRAGENAPALSPCVDGSNCVPVGSTVPRLADQRPDDGGQYGIALRWYAEALNQTDFGFYAFNYHSRLPVASGVSRSSGGLTPADTAGYFAEYPEDIRLYGASFNTSVGAYAFQGEYSYKENQPLQLDDVELLLAGLGAPSQINPAPGATLGNQYIQGFRRQPVSQADLSFTRTFAPNAALRYDQVVLLVEAAATYVHDLPSASELAFDAPATYTPNPGTAAMNAANPTVAGVPVTPYDAYATSFSWGYRALARFTYNNLIGPVNVEPALRFDHDVQGTTPSPIVNFVDGRMSASLLCAFLYLDTWRAELGYTSYFGAGDANYLGDRDYAELSVKYSF